MRICIFTDCFLPGVGGAEIAAHNLARTFSKLGHPTVVLTYGHGNLDEYELPYTVETISPLFYRLGAKTLIEKWAICHFQDKYDFDVINIHKTYVGYAVGKVRDKLNVPVVITAHGGDIQKNIELGYGMRITKPAWEKKIAFAVQKAEALVAISSETAECFTDLGANKDKIHRIANGIDVDRFSKKIELDKKSLGLKENDRIILAVGRYHIKKGYEMLMRSMALLVEKRENIKLLIVGKQSENLRSLVRKLGIGDNVLFVQEQKGKQTNGSLIFPNDFLLSLYKNADIFVSSSIIEGFALVCIEAVAAGLPLVLTRCPGNEDIFEEDGQGGYYVPVGNVEMMAEKIAKLLSNSETRSKFSVFNTKYAREKYSLKKVAGEYIALFEKLVGTQRN